MKRTALLIVALLAPFAANAATQATLTATATQAQFDAGIVAAIQFDCFNLGPGGTFGREVPATSRVVSTVVTFADLGELIGPWGCTARAVGQGGQLGPTLNMSPSSFTLQDPVPAILESFSVTTP